MSDHEIKLHLGCGNRCIPGFLHIDIIEGEHIAWKQDVRSLQGFEDESIDLIYASHVLTYFDWVEVIDVLREWYRVLKVNGVLRLAVPDFQALVKLYNERGLASLLGSLYGRIEVNGQLLYHHMAYDYQSLSFLLRLIGFRNIRPWDWRETKHANVDDCSQSYFPHMDKETGMFLSLNVEADK